MASLRALVVALIVSLFISVPAPIGATRPAPVVAGSAATKIARVLERGNLAPFLGDQDAASTTPGNILAFSFDHPSWLKSRHAHVDLTQKVFDNTKRYAKSLGVEIAADAAARSITISPVTSSGQLPRLNNSSSPFVQVQGVQLVHQGRPFLFVGCNTGDLRLMDPTADEESKSEVIRLLDEMALRGMKVLRTFAFSYWTGDGKNPGLLEEPAALGIDFVIEQAGRRNIKVLLALSDYWSVTGVDRFVKYSPKAKLRDDFWSDGYCRAEFKKLLYGWTHRLNTLTGVMYKDDPTILGWNLINEPHMTTGDPNQRAHAITAWLQEMAAFIKTQDSNHLVSIGSEGFYAGRSKESQERTWLNPAAWSRDEGQDFLSHTRVDGIDFAECHVWPDNWLDTDEWVLANGGYATPEEKLQFARAWARFHAMDALTVGKPMVLEEFGKNIQMTEEGAHRDMFYAGAFDEVEQWAARGGPVVGSLFWKFVPSSSAPLYLKGGPEWDAMARSGVSAVFFGEAEEAMAALTSPQVKRWPLLDLRYASILPKFVQSSATTLSLVQAHAARLQAQETRLAAWQA